MTKLQTENCLGCLPTHFEYQEVQAKNWRAWRERCKSSNPGKKFDKFPFEIKVGYTICILYAERKQFMDGTVGVRQEELEPCWAFKAPLQVVLQESEKLLQEEDASGEGICLSF